MVQVTRSEGVMILSQKKMARVCQHQSRTTDADALGIRCVEDLLLAPHPGHGGVSVSQVPKHDPNEDSVLLAQ